MYLKIKQLKNTIIMRKNMYLAPEAELFFVRFEENIMSPGQPGGAGGDDTIIDDDDLS